MDIEKETENGNTKVQNDDEKKRKKDERSSSGTVNLGFACDSCCQRRFCACCIPQSALCETEWSSTLGGCWIGSWSTAEAEKRYLGLPVELVVVVEAAALGEVVVGCGGGGGGG